MTGTEQTEEKFLDVGLVLFLEAKGGNKNIRYKSSIVGWKPNGVIIIDMPLLNGAYINLTCGCDCIVRYILYGNAYGFEAKVIKNVNDHNLPLVYLSYPQKIEKIGLRKHERMETDIPVVIELSPGEEGASSRIDGIILDLSIGGCLLEIQNQDCPDFGIDTTITLSFTLPNTEINEVKIHSLIKRIQKISNNTKIGVQFIELPPDTKKMVRQLCQKTSDTSKIN